MIVAEKPSVAMSYAKVLGATSRQDGYLEGNGYLVSWCVGHLVELAPPNVYECQVRQVEHRRLAHPAAKVAVSGVSVHQKAVRYPAKADESPGRRQHREQLRCRVVRLGDLRERKKRPHLVEN